MLEESALNHYCHGKSNISFNPTGCSLLFIRKTRMLDSVSPGGLIRALDTLRVTRQLWLE
jgi:hypothetical protein